MHCAILAEVPFLLTTFASLKLFFNEILFFLSVILTAGATILASLFGVNGLYCAIAVQGLMENLFVSKQIILFGLEVTAADIYEIGIIFAINLLQELYGKKAAKAGIWYFFGVSIWFLVFSQIHTAFIPSPGDWTNIHFLPLLKLFPRMVFASTLTSTLSMFLDRNVFSFVRERFGSFTAASIMAMVCSQIFDTLMFTIVGLAGIANNLFDIFAFSLFVKLVAIFMFTPFCLLVKYIARSNKENV